MTHPSDYTNGASLEDCLTNVLALVKILNLKFVTKYVCYDMRK